MVLLLLIFPLCLIIAAISDLLTMTIPNWLCATLALVFFVVASCFGLPQSVILIHIITAILILFLGFSMFYFGWLGGGDAKLITAVSLWLDGGSLLRFFFTMAIWGGILALLFLFFRSARLPELLMKRPFIARLAEPSAGIPYGVAIAIGGILAYPHSALWQLAGRI
ncbi:A24 family peptidase [Methylocystis echinoides]|nr:prepilin peptidase [Methylocystis echinoides]